jgi:hypothetical protein
MCFVTSPLPHTFNFEGFHTQAKEILINVQYSKNKIKDNHPKITKISWVKITFDKYE